MSAVWLVLTLLLGCGGGGDGFSVGTPGAAACDLTLDTLEGRTFVMLEAQPDKTDKENPQARVKFMKGDDGGLEARYTAMSISDVYTYYCDPPKGDGEEREVYCAEKERAQDWCQALEVHEEGSCDRKTLRKLGVNRMSDEDIKTAIKAARDEVKKYRGTPNWDRFKLNNNNLGNKLQGRLYLKVDDKRCRLSLSDMYFTIHEGKGTEDTNPVGINPFVQSDETWMFEHCVEGRNIVADLNEAEPPKDPSQIPADRAHDLGKPVYYYYYGEKEAKATEGCTYTADTWANWKSVAKDVPITPEADGRLFWRGSHTWDSGNLVSFMGKDVAVYEMVRYKQCGGGEKEMINTTCSVAFF